MDGELASILNKKELNEFKAMKFRLPTRRKRKRPNKYWIGAHDLRTEGTWEWTDGKPFENSVF